MGPLSHLVSFTAPKLRPVLRFLTSQGITLAGNLLYGLLCVRWLPTADYAQFVVLFGIQGSMVVLMDIGASSSVIPLIGEHIHDRQLIADYIASLRHIAHRLYSAAALGLILTFPLLVRHRNWTLQTIIAMIAILLVSTWFGRVSSSYGAVLVLMRDRPKWYMGQMISSLGTLTLLLIFAASHWLNGLSAILINVSGVVFMGLFYYYRSQRLLGTKGQATAAKRTAIIRLALPNVPSVIFYALQGQISLMLITYFGRTTSVASIGALGRLGQFFVLFGQMNLLLVEPYFAKLRPQKFKSSYFSALSIVAFICISVTAFSATFPQLFLWILGPHYKNLTQEVIYVIAASSLGYFSGVLWVIHSSRKYIYWWSNIATIVLSLTIQIAFILKGDLSSIKTLLLLNLVTACGGFLINLLTGAYGLINGPRSVGPGDQLPPIQGTLDPEELIGEDPRLPVLEPESSD
jgi:hypothetical protein